MDYVEGLEMYIAHLISAGYNVYSAEPRPNGFTSASYPLIAYIPSIVGYRTFGTVSNSLVVARAFHFISSLISLVLLYRLSKLLTGREELGLMSVLVLLSLRPFNYWSPTLRPDVLALPVVLSIIIATLSRRPKYITVLLPALFCIKQQYLDIVMALLLFSIITMKKDVIRYTLLGVIFGSILYIVNAAVYPGFFRSIIIYNALHERSLHQGLEVFKYSFMYNWWSFITLLVSTTLATYYLLFRKGDLVSLYLIVNLLSSLSLSSKLGSNTNYFIVLSSLVAVSFVRVPRLHVHKNLLIILIVLSFIASLWTTIDSYGFNAQEYVEGMSLHDALEEMGLENVPAWSTDLYEAYIIKLNVPVDPFYYSRLVEKKILPDIEMWNLSLNLIIWDYNRFRITKSLLRLTKTYSNLLSGEVYALYYSGEDRTEEFLKLYTASYSKYFSLYEGSLFNKIYVIKNINKILDVLMDLMLLIAMAVLISVLKAVKS